MGKRSFVAGFFICMFLDVMTDSLILWSRDDTATYPSIIFVSLYFYIVGFFVHVFIFSTYFFMVRTLAAMIERRWKFMTALAVFAVFYLILTMFTEWSFFQDQYPGFRDYINKGTWYFTDARIVAIVLTIMGWAHFNQTHSPNRPSSADPPS